ncbi:MAG: SPW repeat protein [Gemmatimonadetes bacterium]|nr:SPW repeat protein [Gemmatimonadota bacterium]NIU29890.1 SPW repeat protein [Gemmatimonadota bacterium]NIV60297.1 hypothetical protein [Gemmatimonadota bacterium]NIW62960.1 hypothetical protein [Gemmatimonadota bacterium]NIX38339.1 hypothetical protein [Gemmatimonadota bacterium]
MTAARWTNGILGLWLGLSAFLGFTAFGSAVNMVTVGAIAAGIGLAIKDDIAWQGWTTALAGLWLVIAGFVPSFQTGSGLVWNSILLGAVLVLASIPFGRGRPATPRVRETAAERPAPTVQKPSPQPTPPSEKEERAEEGTRELVHG